MSEQPTQEQPTDERPGGGTTVFIAEGSGDQKGIYTNLGGSLVKVIDIDDSLGGVDVDNVFISRHALSRGQIVFGVNDPGGSSTSIDAIWIADSGLDPCGQQDVPALRTPGLVAFATLLVAAAFLLLSRRRSVVRR